MKISDRSYPPDPPDMQPLKIEHALVLLEGFEFWQLFGDFFGYLEMYAFWENTIIFTDVNKLLSII